MATTTKRTASAALLAAFLIVAPASAAEGEARPDAIGDVSLRLMEMPPVNMVSFGVKRLALGQFTVHACKDALMVEKNGRLPEVSRPDAQLRRAIAAQVKAAVAAELSKVRNLTLVNLSDFDRVATGQVPGLSADFVKGIRADGVLYADIWADMLRVESANTLAHRLVTYDINDLPVGWRTVKVRYPFLESSATLVVRFTVYRLQPTPHAIGVRTVTAAASDISAAYNLSWHRTFNVLRATKIAVAIAAKAAVVAAAASGHEHRGWAILAIEVGRAATVAAINAIMYQPPDLTGKEDAAERRRWESANQHRFATDGIRDGGCPVQLCDTAQTRDMLTTCLARETAEKFAREIAPSFTVYRFPVLAGDPTGSRLVLHGDFRRADAHYRKRSSLGAADRYNYALAMAGLEHYPEASDELEKLIESDPREDLYFRVQATLQRAVETR